MAENLEVGQSQAEHTAQATIESSPNTSDSFRLETSSSAKQKRKRTSPRDHAILESAYQKNSKPDKEDRLELVRQVNLGEKEVQIWFQNRRQNDRRKSKPLQPHELIPHFRNGIPVEATRQLPSPQNSQNTSDPITNCGPQLSQVDVDQSSPTQAHQSTPVNRLSSQSPLAQQTPHTTSGLSTPPSSIEQDSTRKNAQPLNSSPTQLHSGLSQQMTKKRSHEEMNETSAGKSHQDPTGETKSLRRTSSFVRLAVSADGSVKVRVNDETTPSPPKERPQPPPTTANRRSSGISRAQSDVSSTFQFRDVSAIRGPPGRSRDARTWEFYCDRSARSSLAAHAEQEATGSAVGAIGLVRSAASRRQQPLAGNKSRQNTTRRSQMGVKHRSGLSRAQSSMARLQSSDGISEDSVSKKGHGHRRQSSSGDSDKENWLPGTRESNHGLRRTEDTEARDTVLRRTNALDSSHTERPLAATLPSANDQENRMRGERGKGKAKGDDLDCVQGLLSLSQGAWR